MCEGWNRSSCDFIRDVAARSLHQIAQFREQLGVSAEASDNDRVGIISIATDGLLKLGCQLPAEEIFRQINEVSPDS